MGYEPGHNKFLKIGGIAGIVAICGLLVAVAQLWQAVDSQGRQDLAQATEMALNLEQLSMLEKITTLQSMQVNSEMPAETATAIAIQIRELETTLEAVNTNELAKTRDLSENPEEFTPTPIPIPTSTPTPSLPTNTPTPKISTFDGRKTDQWTINAGSITNPSVGGNTGNENDGYLTTSAPGDGKTSYYIAPSKFFGNWREFSELRIDIWSSGGTHYTEGSGFRGDVYIESGDFKAYRHFDYRPPEQWETFIIPLNDDDQLWVLGNGTRSLEDVLSRVTAFHIRAEYGKGNDESGIDNIELRK